MSKSSGGGWLPRLQSLLWVTFMQLGTQQSCDMWQASCFVCSFPLAPPSHSSFCLLTPLPCCRTWAFYNGAFSSRISQSFFLSSFSPILLPSLPPLSEYLWCKITSLSQSGASFPLQTSSPASVSLSHLGTLGQSVCILQPPCLPLRREGVREVM